MFKKAEKNGVVFFVSDIIPAPHGFSTRLGGVSNLPQTKSMNFGSSVADPNTHKNIEIFTSSLSLAPLVARTRQIHSAKIHKLLTPSCIGEVDGDGFYRDDGDGFITNLPNISICVRTADCLPVIMSDRQGKTVTALHAGWRGSVKGIVSRAVREFGELGTEPQDIFAALGPCIGTCCFRVGEDFITEFRSSPAAHLLDKVVEKRDGEYFCNLREINRLLLIEAGVPVENIDISNECTMHSPEIFFSHRNTGFERGTMGSVVCCKP